MVQPRPSRVTDSRRLAALRATELLDTPPEEVFDRLSRLASAMLRAPVALVSLVDADRQFFKSCVGLPEPWASRRETPLSHSVCRLAVQSGDVVLVRDAREHPELRDSPVTEELGVVAYAGVPLVMADGEVLGTLCVIDRVPRDWTDAEVAALSELAAAAVREIELRRLLRSREADHAAALRDARSEALEQLATGLRHEVNNALSGLLLSVDLLSGSGAASPEGAARLRVIHDQAWRIHDVLRRISDVDSLRCIPSPLGRDIIDLSDEEGKS